MTDCNCDMRTKLVGDGCSICNPDMAEKISLDNFFDEDAEYRQLQFGEKIMEGDVFYCDGGVHRATDIGNGVVTSHHFNHYRLLSHNSIISSKNLNLTGGQNMQDSKQPLKQLTLKEASEIAQIINDRDGLSQTSFHLWRNNKNGEFFTTQNSIEEPDSVLIFTAKGWEPSEENEVDSTWVFHNIEVPETYEIKERIEEAAKNLTRSWIITEALRDDNKPDEKFYMDTIRKIAEVDKVKLVLTPTEVNWLKERMQNCAEKFPQDEPENDKLMRENFYKHLPYM